jgi:hypothetical protein
MSRLGALSGIQVRITPSQPQNLPLGRQSIDASGPWFDVEEGCYVEEPASRLGSCEQQDVPSAPAQNRPQTLLQSFQPLQDQISQQDIGNTTQTISAGPAPYSLPKPPDSSDDGWSEESMAKMARELGLFLGEQISILSANASSLPRPRSVEALLDESQSRERAETIGRLEDPQDASRHGTPAQGLGWEQQETQVVVETLGRRELEEKELAGEAEGVEMQQQEELGWQEEAPAQRNMDDQLDLVEVVDADDPKDKEAIEALPIMRPEVPEIDEHRFRLRGIRTRQLAERQTKTIQYRVVWGKHPNRSDSWSTKTIYGC